ncbi:TIGR02536 family ethanolamine utilization protein [Romboutsia lituseburensis]|uniref:Ethanolamine utilization protein n=1 Tax=Romboutsia lituseburensis DSM 797 TaxID=1121325 RepID=A0A1G9I269_9FIRM|nr:TIGR02536 family ethanolamine utilization protein [Romboutsia lituseburensis]CEH34073.1 Ethanolamine utilization protein [Romboutsia lituseburensis]SDL19331.1 ethanolamine utilization protein [Romboutsia lituseburensis DSM 797]
MNYDNLVNLIVEEIYKKINSTDKLEITNKPKAVLIYENNQERFNFLKEDLDIVPFEKSVRDCEVIIVSKLCMRGLCNLALGNSVSDEERFILKMLMKGKKVYVLDEGIEYKRYKETAPKALYNKYLSYEDEILKFGVEVVKDLSAITLKDKINTNKIENLGLNSLDKKTSSEEVKIDDEFSLDLRTKKLISESDLRKPMVNGIKNVIVSKKSILTPLATDFMRIHHLKLKRM